MKISWGGKLEKNGKYHGENRAMKRGINKNQIKKALLQPDNIERQSIDCFRYSKEVEGKVLRIVAVKENRESFRVITCFWED